MSEIQALKSRSAPTKCESSSTETDSLSDFLIFLLVRTLRARAETKKKQVRSLSVKKSWMNTGRLQRGII